MENETFFTGFRKRSLWVLAVALMLSFPAFSQIVNWDFEQTEPNELGAIPIGWNTENYALVHREFTPCFEQRQENLCDWSFEGNSVSTEGGNAFLVLSTGDYGYDACSGSYRNSLTDKGVVWQDCKFYEGETIYGRYFFGTGDYVGWNDIAEIKLIRLGSLDASTDPNSPPDDTRFDVSSIVATSIGSGVSFYTYSTYDPNDPNDPNDYTYDPNDIVSDPNDYTYDPNDIIYDPNDYTNDPNDPNDPNDLPPYDSTPDDPNAPSEIVLAYVDVATVGDFRSTDGWVSFSHTFTAVDEGLYRVKMGVYDVKDKIYKSYLMVDFIRVGDPLRAGDFNADGKVNFLDILAFDYAYYQICDCEFPEDPNDPNSICYYENVFGERTPYFRDPETGEDYRDEYGRTTLEALRPVFRNWLWKED